MPYCLNLLVYSIPNSAPANVATSPKPTNRLSWISPCGAINAPQNKSTNPPIESTAAVMS